MASLCLCGSFARVRVSPKALSARRNIACAPVLLQAPTLRPVAVIDTSIQAKKNKLKTRKAAAKRFKVTSKGKVMVRCSGKQHINEKMSAGHLRRLSKEKAVFAGDVNVNIRKAMPYHKISMQQQRIANKKHD